MPDSTLLNIITSNNLNALESYAFKRYALNMDFFKQLNIKLFNELNQPPKRYNLYFNNALNIIDMQNNHFVYPTTNGIHQMIAQNLALSENPLNNKAYTIHTNNLTLHKLESTKIPLTASICNPIMDMMQSEFSGANRFHLPSLFLPNMTIFGLLGGIFLQLLIEKGYYFHSLLLFEEDIDLFRISLFFVDYPLLFERVSERSCYMFVKDLLHKEFVQSYFSQRRITNNFLRLELSLYDSEKMQAVKECVDESYRINARGWGSFDDEMIGARNTFINLSDSSADSKSAESSKSAKSKRTKSAKILPKQLKYAVLKDFKRINAPICVVGNGASLDNLLPFIKANAKNMIIFSCGTALKPLKNAGIKPDFQIEIERISYLRGVLESAPLEDTTLLCGSIIDPSALDIAKEAFIFMRGGSASAYFGAASSVVEYAAPYVGNAGFALACALSDEVLICGLDCGYIKGKSKHAKHSYYGKESSEIPQNAFIVQGNGTKEVYSDALFSLSSLMMSRAIAKYKPKLVINLGDGAYIKGTRAVSVSDFTLRNIDKNAHTNALKALTSNDRNAIFSHNSGYESDILAYKMAMMKAFRTKITNKKALFSHIDNIYALSLKHSASMPFIGILFEGSISHILHTLMLCALHIPNDDIELFYAKSVGIIESGLNKMHLSYKISLLATSKAS